MARIQFAIIALSTFLGSSALSAAATSFSSPVLSLDSRLAPLGLGWLGVLLDPSAERPTIVEVIPDSPAAKGGLEPGDVFLAVGKSKVGSIDDLQRLLGATAVGSEVLLLLDRGGDKLELTVTLGERPAEVRSTPPAPAKPVAPDDADKTSRLKRQPAPSKPAQETAQDPGRAYLGVSVTEAGKAVRIERVVEGSPADRAGLRAGDLLRAIDARKIGNLGDLDKAMGRLRPGQKVRVDYRRGDDSADLMLEMGRAAEEGDAPAVGEQPPSSKPTSKPTSKPKIGSSEASSAARQDPQLRASAQAEQNRVAEAELARAREQMAAERAKLESELQRARQEMEREREQSQQAMTDARQALEREMRRTQEQVQKEAERMRRAMEKERQNMESEIQKARQNAAREMQRAEEQMQEERGKMERELRRRQVEAEEEMQRVHRSMNKERQALEEELQRNQQATEKEIARQRERVNAELKLAREEMDRERRRMSKETEQGKRVPIASPQGSSAGSPTADLEKRLSGMRREFDRIRAELRDLQSILEKKRR